MFGMILESVVLSDKYSPREVLDNTILPAMHRSPPSSEQQ